MIATALPAWFNDLPITTPLTLTVVDAVAVLLAIVLILPMRRRGWRLWILLAIVIGAVAGGATIWWVGDLQDTFNVSPTWVDRIWTGAVFAGVLVALVNIVLAGWFRKVVAVVSIVVFVIAGGLAINRDVGEFLTPGQLLGTNGFQRILLPKGHSLTALGAKASAFDPTLYKTWRPPADMPKVGRVGEVSIPGKLSHFAARDAYVYLPPAALVKHAPDLPVVILLSGQPSAPSAVIDAGIVPQTLNAIAARNNGLAPIVVVPDQLGPSAGNPMCVDGPLGNSATYILRDVTAWIRTHLNAESGRLALAVGGFSQGATCSIQFASAHPNLFGTFVDISGQQYPTLGNDAQAIQQGFHGSLASFDAAKPASIMAAHGRYTNLVGVFGVGEYDKIFGTNTRIMSALAEQHGIRVVRYVSPGSAHDWTTATNGFAEGFDVLMPRMGLSAHQLATAPQSAPLPAATPSP